MILVILLCIVAVVFTSYTNGNKQANDLMVKLGGPMENYHTWGKYKSSIDYLLFWLLPVIPAVVMFGWWGLLYLPIVWLGVAKLSGVFMVGQFKKRLASAERYYNDSVKKWKDASKPTGFDAVNIETEEHKVNKLKWLISHPKMAHHLALSALDDKARPEVVAAFEVQVEHLNSISKSQRMGSEVESL